MLDICKLGLDDPLVSARETIRLNLGSPTADTNSSFAVSRNSLNAQVLRTNADECAYTATENVLPAYMGCVGVAKNIPDEFKTPACDVHHHGCFTSMIEPADTLAEAEPPAPYAICIASFATPRQPPQLAVAS